MFEFAGYLFTASEVVGAILSLLAINALGTVVLLFKKGKSPMSAASDILNSAVSELENSSSQLASAIDAFIAARADNDDEAMLEASNRIKSITESIRSNTAKLVV